MLEKFSTWLRSIAKGWLVLVFFAIEIAFMGFILPTAEATIKSYSGGIGPIDLMIAPAPETLANAITAYGTEGRAFYTTIELTADILYPIAYAFFYSLLISFIFKRAFNPENKVHWLNVLPFGAWLFDLIENIIILTLFSGFPNLPAPLLGALMLVNTIKWSFAGLSILSLVFGLSAWVFKKIKR